eukprot:3287708-Pyramimonas_sp.AAC.1
MLIAFRANDEQALQYTPSRMQMVEAFALNERLDALQNLQVQASRFITDDSLLDRLEDTIEQCARIETSEAEERAGGELPESLRRFHGTREALLDDEPASQGSWERYTSALTRCDVDCWHVLDNLELWRVYIYIPCMEHCRAEHY